MVDNQKSEAVMSAFPSEEDLLSDMAMGSCPTMVIQAGQRIVLPLNQKAADLLYKKMNGRFTRWTGKGLRGYSPTDEASETS